MEAWRFGFDPSLPPAFKFDPTDADLVAFFLLPRALNLPTPLEHAVVDADPCSCPPWELLRRHGHADSDHAFFFGPPRAVTKTGAMARTSRTVPAAGEVRGRWHGQKGREEWVSLVRDGGEVVVVKYRKYNLTYYNEPGEGDEEEKVNASGWVMNEYQIVDPPMRAVLARVKVAERATKQHRKKRKAIAAAADEARNSSVNLYQDDQQPAGPSSSYDHDHHRHVAGPSGGAQGFGVPESGGGDVGGDQQPVVSYTDDLLRSGDGIDCYVDDNDNFVFGNVDNNYFDQGYGAGNGNYGGGSSKGYYHGGGAASYKA